MEEATFHIRRTWIGWFLRIFIKLICFLFFFFSSRIRTLERKRSFITVCVSWKDQPKIFKFVVCNPCQSSPSLTILVSLWFGIISLVFFYLKARLHRRFLSRQLDAIFVASKLHQVSNMFETPAISRRQIAVKIAPGLHVRFWSCNFERDKNCIKLLRQKSPV